LVLVQLAISPTIEFVGLAIATNHRDALADQLLGHGGTEATNGAGN